MSTYVYAYILTARDELILLLKPGAPATGRCTPGFLELVLSVNVCVRVCLRVYLPRGYQ